MTAELLRRRASGVLMPLFCLPSKHGIGDLGPKAAQFLDFLAESGQRYWQMLPITPSGEGDSPYQSLSAFAISPLYLWLGELADLNLVGQKELRRAQDLDYERVDYVAVEQFKNAVCRQAFEALESKGGMASLDGLAEFEAREREWLEPWTLYMAIKREQGLKDWTHWSDELKDPGSPAVAEAAQRLERERRYQAWLQFMVQRQWDRVRGAAAERGISLVGDLPIFVSMDSADAWSRQDLFRFDRVAGVPPDYFSEDGQVWGNPVYRWHRHGEEGFHWWKQRFRRLLGMFDLVRVDHFIGFQKSWSVETGAKSGKEGRYEPGPGLGFFRSVEAELGGQLGIIAEDLGALTPDVEALRDETGYPGMKVLQFAFGSQEASGPEQPHAFRHHVVAYTGTHDNNTCVGWYTDGDGPVHDKAAFEREREFALRYMGASKTNIHWDMIRTVWSSVANTAIVPVQDLFGLGSEARINRPGTPEGNWRWRLSSRLLNRRTARHLKDITGLYGRLGN